MAVLVLTDRKAFRILGSIIILFLETGGNVRVTIAQTPAREHPARSQRATKKISHPAPAEYLTEPFDITSRHLQPGFKGHDIAAIWKAVTSADGTRAKSEFETSGQYSERKARFGNVVLIGNTASDDYLAFTVAPRYSGDADPDEPMGGGFIFGNTMQIKRLSSLRFLEASSLEKTQSPYVPL